MRAVVIGAGVVGVTSAYYLARAGFAVTVLERRSSVALETSYANAGQISPGYAAPWAAPGIPFKALRWMMQRDSPLHMRIDGSWWQLQWLTTMLRNCTSGRYERNKADMVQLAEFSRDSLRILREQENLQYEARTLGTLQLFRTQQQWLNAQRDIRVLERCGVPHTLLDQAGCLTYEPALVHAGQKIVGGLHLPGDETGDCQLFTQQLAQRASQLGVIFRFDTQVNRLQVERGRIVGAQVGDASISADHFIVAAASDSRTLLYPLGIKVPVYPVKGYSLTVPLRDETGAPRSSILDETYKVAITRFDQRIRVGGMAELVGQDLTLNPRRQATLIKVASELFPHGADWQQGEFWTGLRPMTPDGMPRIQQISHPNLWLNTGHGTLGWTMACGSARRLVTMLTQPRSGD